MKMKLAVAAGLLAVLAGCSSAPAEPSGEDIAKQKCLGAVAAKMKDPDSVKFNAIVIEQDTSLAKAWLVSGEVNATNSYGGYTGFKEFNCQYAIGWETTRVQMGSRTYRER